MKSDVALKKYLDDLAPASVKNRRLLLEKFFVFCEVTPLEAVAWQKKALNDDKFKFVDLAYKFLNRHSLSVGSQQVKMGCIRGFFRANRASLPEDKHKFRTDKPKVVGHLTVEEFKQFLLACNVDYRAAFMMQFQMGGGVGELVYVNEHGNDYESLADHIWNEVRKGAQIIRLDMPGRKQSRNITPYYTFIGSDAINCLKEMFHNRGWKRDSVLFRTKRGKPVTANSLQVYFRQVAFKLGLIKRVTFPCIDCQGETVRIRRRNRGAPKILYRCLNPECQAEHDASEIKVPLHVLSGVRYRMRPHELRDLFRTEWHRAQTMFGVDGDAGEFFMGHTIDPLKYDKIMQDKEFGLEQYRKAMPMLNVLSEDPRKIKRVEVEGELAASRRREEILTKRLVEVEQKMNHYVKVLDNPKLLKILEALEEKE